MRTFMNAGMTAGAGAASLLLCAALVTALPTSAEETVNAASILPRLWIERVPHLRSDAGKPDPQRHLGGSEVGFQIPGLGIFYPPNLTPEPETGIGSWSETDIIKAVRTGVRGGRVLAPVMPYHSYDGWTAS